MWGPERSGPFHLCAGFRRRSGARSDATVRRGRASGRPQSPAHSRVHFAPLCRPRRRKMFIRPARGAAHGATARPAERIEGLCGPTRGTGHSSAKIRSDRPECAIRLPFTDRLRPTKTWAGGTAPNRCDTACSDSRPADGGESSRQAASRRWRPAARVPVGRPASRKVPVGGPASRKVPVGRLRLAGPDRRAQTGGLRDHSAASGRKGRKVMRCRAQGPSVPIASRWRSVP